jgi:hypothetical protein
LAVSTTSKSPKDVLTEAWSVTGQVFPKYAHKNSPKKFTQCQLFACLVLKNFLKLDDRGLQQLLSDCSDLKACIELKSVPHFTTFQKASKKLLAAEPVQRLLSETVRRMMGRRKYVDLAAVDSTGLESTAASPYFVKRRSRQENPWKTVVYHRTPKLAIVCKTFDQFIIGRKTGAQNGDTGAKRAKRQNGNGKTGVTALCRLRLKQTIPGKNLRALSPPFKVDGGANRSTIVAMGRTARNR